MAVIGELQDYALEPPPGCALISGTWTFSPQDQENFVGGFIVNNNAGTIIPAPPFTGDSLNLYYIAPNDVNFTVDIKYFCPDSGDQEEQMQGDCSYLAPTVAAPSVVGAGKFSIVLNGPGGFDLLSLGTDNGDVGFGVTCKVTWPEDQFGDGSGQVGFAQFVAGTITYVPFEGDTLQLVIPGNVLDTAFPYPGSQVLGVAGQTRMVQMNDSPAYWLPSTGCQSVSVDLNFSAFLMYQVVAAGIPSIWVAFGLVNWTASATASRPEPGDDWILTENSVWYGGVEESYGTPPWTTNVTTLQRPFLAQLHQVFGPSPDGELAPRRRWRGRPLRLTPRAELAAAT